MRLKVAMLATLCAATTASCLLGDDDDGDGSSYVAVTQIEDAYQDATCAHYANCGIFPDKETCLAANLSSTGINFDIDANIIAAIYAGRVRYNGSNVKECFDSIANKACDKTSETARVPSLACSDYLSGTLASGEMCILDQECISQQCSGGGDSCVPGVCIGDTPPIRDVALVGEQCNQLDQCEQGAYCDQQTSLCTLLKSTGSSCTLNSECQYGLACTGPAGSRTCGALPGPSESCYVDSTFIECRDEGTVCDTTTTFCEPVGGPGTMCNSSSHCSMFYPCNFATGMCSAGPGLGEACSGANRCFDIDTFCDTSNTSTCIALRGNGETCQQDAECSSGFCDQTGVSPICAMVTTCDF
jgi:hypothetical protein